MKIGQKQEKLTAKLLGVSDAFVLKTKQAKEAVDIRTLLLAQDSSYKPFLTAICHKTGRPMHMLPALELQQVIAAHDNTPRAILALKAAAISQCSPAWLLTDDSALRALFDADPVGYWIYAASILADKAKKQATDSIEDSWLLVQAKHAGWKNLHNLRIDEVIRCNEMFRRILALTKRINRAMQFSVLDFPDITQSQDSFDSFCNKLKNAVIDLVQKHSLQREAEQRQRQNLRLADIANIQLELGTGYQQFAQSGKGRISESLTDLEIWDDISEIFDDVFVSRLDNDTAAFKVRKGKLPSSKPTARKFQPNGGTFTLKITARKENADIHVMQTLGEALAKPVVAAPAMSLAALIAKSKK